MAIIAYNNGTPTNREPTTAQQERIVFSRL
jgi:hypothetical protein